MANLANTVGRFEISTENLACAKQVHRLDIFSLFAKYMPMPPTPATIAVCKYVVKRGKEAEFAKLVARHYPTMSKLGLTAKEPHRLFKGTDHKTGKTVFIELFPWKDLESPEKAHRMPEVMAIWEPMGALCESMEFPNVAPFDPADAG